MGGIETAAALGGASVLGVEVESEIDFVQLVERGLPVSAIERLVDLGDLSPAELGEIIPRRTVSHARGRSRLSSELSDRIARAAGAIAFAHEVFADRDKANRWLRRPNRVLDGATPLSLLRSGSGAQLVETILTRIAYGVYS